MMSLVNKQTINPVKETARAIKDVAKLYLNHYKDSEYLEWYFKWYFKHSKRLLKFKNIHKGESCFIIGNGPSLNKMDLSPLSECYTFGMNKIFMMFDKVDLNLSYHVAVNELVIEQSVKEFESLSCPSFLCYKVGREFIRPLDHIYFIATGWSINFQKDLLQEIYVGYTVTYVAMQIAFYMGFKQVFLIGVDHNFTVAGNPCEKQFLQGGDPNHFAPGYFGNQEWILPDLEASELSYNIARFYFNRAGRQIYDATVDGKLQIFPKISYEQALDACRKK